MNTSLLELMQLGVKMNYEFSFKIIEEKTNHLSINDEAKIIEVVIGDPDDEELPKLIENLKEKLK